MGTGGEELFSKMKNNKQADQTKTIEKQAFIGNPVSILELYQHNLCVHYGKDGTEGESCYSILEQLQDDSSKIGKSGDIPSKLKPTEEKKEDPTLSGFSTVALETLNKINCNSMSSLEKERNSLNKAEGEKEENQGNEEASLSCSDKPGVDNLGSLSDSLYDSFSSCASQGSNDVQYNDN
nr:PREDICTED: uncharacterized protein LOC106704918 [Latimeria chalumnae]|eukprot:XP_014348511.1 PREDICTED: uncharacterized protein LOC106704918 [Latimeria chalumnae]